MAFRIDPLRRFQRPLAIVFYDKASFMGMQAPVLQSAALPYRVSADGMIEVLLISMSAAREAYEEAGVNGEIEAWAAGRYRAIKHLPCGGSALVEVWVHRMQVIHELDEWPKKARRDLRWCPVDTVAALVDEPMIADLCLHLAAAIDRKLAA